MTETGLEYRFRIEAYTPETMPLGRLAEYLSQLAKMLGEERSVHLLELEAGSTTLVHKIDAEAVSKVQERVAAVLRADAPREAMDAYRNLNRLLRDDNGCGVLVEAGGAEILEFPGKKEERQTFSSVEERGELDGEVVRLGGTGDPVPVTLQTSDATMSGCYAKRSIAKPLANLLFEPVRVFGVGRWTRDHDGKWLLNRFVIDRFEKLTSESLSQELVKLRSLTGEWGDGALDEILKLRYGGV